MSDKAVEKGISEPVITIIKAMEQRPDTFKVRMELSKPGEILCRATYFFIDSVTSLKAVAVNFYFAGEFDTEIVMPFNITQDEKDALIKVGEKLIKYKKEKIDEVNKARNLMRRDRWLETYRREIENRYQL